MVDALDEAAKKIVGDVAEEALSAYIAGKPFTYTTVDPELGPVVETDLEWAAGGHALGRAFRAKYPDAICMEVADTAKALVKEIATDIRRRTARGAKAVEVRRTGAWGIDIGFEGIVSGGSVPPEVKLEMAEMARAGLTAVEIGLEYGYPEPDILRILKSTKIKIPKAPTPMPVTPVHVAAPAEQPKKIELGITGIDAEAELAIAEALLAGVSANEVAKLSGASAEQIEAVRKAWAGADASEAASEAIAYQRERKTKQATRRTADPTAVGEILFCSGVGLNGWRVEIAPALEPRLRKEIEALRFVSVRGSATTEYDIVGTNMRRYADRNLPASDKRFKEFAWRGTRISEFKGKQARVFAGTMKSVYPGGLEVWRCGLVHCVVKKRDEASNEDLEKAVENLGVWRKWRDVQDAEIVKNMRKKP